MHIGESFNMFEFDDFLPLTLEVCVGKAAEDNPRSANRLDKNNWTGKGEAAGWC